MNFAQNEVRGIIFQGVGVIAYPSNEIKGFTTEAISVVKLFSFNRDGVVEEVSNLYGLSGLRIPPSDNIIYGRFCKIEVSIGLIKIII